MNWIVIFILSSPALIMGLLSLKGYTQNKELFIWLSLGFISVAYIFFYVHSHPFFHLFIIGLFWGIINSIIQSSFYPTYIANNKKAARSYAKISKSMNPRIVMLLIGLATGIATGLILGAASWIFKKLLYNI